MKGWIAICISLQEITVLLPDFYSHLKQYDEEQEDEGNTMIHPIFELEINKMDDHKEEAGDRQRDSLVDEMFPSVSERSISVEYTLDSQLTSIIEAPEENEDDVFLSGEMTNSGSITGSSGLKCDGSLLGGNWEGDGETWEEDGEDQEVVIQFLPHVVTIGDQSYEYCSDSDESVKARSLNEVQEIAQHTEIDESPANNYQKPNEQIIVESLETSSQFSNRNLIMSSSPLPTHNVSKSSNDVIGGAPHISSTPSKPSSRPTSRMSSTTSRSSIFPEGTFVGRARHKDGSLMTVVFQVSVCTRICTCMYMYMYVCMDIYMYMYIYMYVCTCMYIWTYTYMYMYYVHHLMSCVKLACSYRHMRCLIRTLPAELP